MNYEEKIKELTERIEKLEKAESKRIIKRRIKIFFKLLKYIIIIFLLISGYNYINDNYIKPYKEKIDYADDKIKDVESLINDKWEIIQKYNPFN